MKEKWFDKAARNGARVLEIMHWVIAALLVVLLVVTFLGEAAVTEVLDAGMAEYGSELSTYGFHVVLTADEFHDWSIAAFRLFLVVAAVMISLMAMVFRNLFLILRNARDTTPFQPENIRLLREIGYFCIAQPIAGLAASPLIPLFAGAGAAEGSIDIDCLIIGVVALCLTRVFARGIELERDTEGLL